MPDGRKHRLAHVCAGVAALVATLSTSLVTATPAAADPDKQDIQHAQERAHDLFHSAEVASERLNEARAELHDSQVRLRSLDADLTRQQAKVDGMRGRVASMVVDNFQSGALSTASQVVLSKDPDSFIDNLSAVSAYTSQQKQVLSDYAAELRRLHLRKQAVDHETEAADRVRQRMAVQKSRLDARAQHAQEVYDGLKAKARQAMSSGTWNGPVPGASGRAGAAVSFAMAQRGKAYVWGATGPDSYDCSGLTMAAWRQAGVSLPHSSSAQYSSGPHVSESQLQPGDLVFYYQPISHVGIYIGNGQIVHAANPGSGVTTSPLHSMPYVGAVRPG